MSIMSIITNAFRSAKEKAIRYFHLGDSVSDLNDKGAIEFAKFIYMTDETQKAAFLDKVVERYNARSRQKMSKFVHKQPIP